MHNTRPLVKTLHDPIQNLWLTLSQQPHCKTAPSRLGQIIAADAVQRLLASQWTAPTFEVAAPVNCKHGLREDWCAFCKPCWDYLAPKKPMEAKRSYQQQKKRKKDFALSTGGVLYPSERIAQEGTDKVKPGADTLWSIVPACDLPKPEARFHQVTPEDVDWCERQSAFAHSHAMPRKAKNFCPELGMYLLENWEPRIEHTTIAPCVVKSWAITLQEWNNSIKAAKAAKVEEDRRMKLFYKQCDGLSPEQFEKAQRLPFKGAVRYVAACKRWLVEKAMVAKGHPNAPYEVRSLNEIVNESRTFPN